MTREDKMAKDIRSRLKEMSNSRGGKLFTGTAKMFLASTNEVMVNRMPTIGNMIDMNRDLLSDTMRFMRAPIDSVGRGVSRALGSEDVRSVRRLGQNMLDDLKTGNIYDPNRDRTEFGERTRDLLNNFGGIDMGGFQSDGSYVEPGNSSERKYQKNLMEYQEENSDKRTVATLDAINYSTRAKIAHDDALAQQNIRLSIKQHSQLMSGMSNMVTQQAAMVTSINSLSASMLEVTRESHQQIMEQLNQTNQLLTTIAMNTRPPQPDGKPYKDDMSFMSANGAIDVRKYLKTVRKNLDNKYGISSTMSMMTGGMGIKGMTEMLQNNPWMAVTTVAMEKMLPEYLKTAMDTTQKYMENFIPSLLTKFADRGRRFDNAAPGEKKLSDFVMGLFGVAPKAGKPGVDNVLRDPNAQAVMTNRTIHAIEQVIPMWLSRIYSGITGDDLSMYNYRTGRMEKAKYALARETHAANDYVGHMGTAAYSINERARAMKFKNPKDDEAFRDYVYQYLNGAAANGRTLINPYKSKKVLMDELPDGDDAYKDALIALLRSMPRKDLMKLSSEMQRARSSRNAASNATYTDLQESGLGILFSGVVDSDIQRSITSKTKKKRYGLDESDIDDIVADAKAHPIRNGIRAVKSSNEAVNDILDVLNRGIITYTYVMGNAKNFKDGKIPGADTVLDAQKNASTVKARLETLDAIRKQNKEENEKAARLRREATVQDRDRNRLVVTNGKNRTSFETMLDIQRDINVDLGGYYTVDNPETKAYLERQKAKSNAEYLKSQFGIKDSRGVDAAPFRLATQALQTVDNAMFKFIFGEDVPEGYGDNDNQVTSFMHTMELRLKGEWEMAKDWFSTNIGEPLKNFFLGENSIIGRTVSTAKQRASEAFSRFGNRIHDRFMERHGDKVSALKAKGQDTGSAVANVMMDAVDRFLYGDMKEGRGKVTDKDGSVQYGGFVGRLKRAGDNFQTFMFGADPDKDPNQSRKKFDFLKKELNIAAPDMIIGGGLGILGSMLLPGGPVLGAMLGMGAGLLKGSETFQEFLFGEKMVREVTVIGSDGNPVMVRDPKTHRMVPKTRKIDSRRGGLIDGPIYDGIKNYVPKVTGGAAAGWLIGGGLLPGLAGHLIGGFAGSMVGLVASSDRLKRMLFGDEEDESGESGLFSKNMREKVLKAIRDHGGGMLAGKVAGSLVGSMAGGLLPTAIGAMVGPVLGSVGAVAGFFAGPKLMNMIFGEEAEVETVDPKTGKRIKKKERMGGMFGKVYDATRDELIRPFAEKMNQAGKKIQDWFHESIIDPLSRSMDPAKEAMHNAGEAITRSIANIGDHIGSAINNAVGMPLKDFMKEKVITPLGNITSKIFGTVGKILGGIISAPFKAMEYIFTGSVQGTSARERRNRHREAEKENRRQIRRADRDARRSINRLNDITGALNDYFGPDDDTDEVFDEAQDDRRSRAADAVKKENKRERRRADKAKSVSKAKSRRRREDAESKQEIRDQIREVDQAKRREERETVYGASKTRKVSGTASGVGARAGSSRVIGKIYDALLDIRKDVAHIRARLDKGVPSGRGGGGRRRGPGLIGSLLGLPFKVAGAAVRGAGDVAGGVLNAGGKILKGGVGLAGSVLALPFKLFATAGKILVNAVSGVAAALGGIVNGLVHAVTGAVGLIGNILGGALNIAASAGIGIAKGAFNIATAIPRAAVGIIGAGAKAAGGLIGGGIKLAGSIISAPFKLIGSIFGGGKRKHPPASYKPIGGGSFGGQNYSAKPARAPRPGIRELGGIDKFGMKTSQGLALRVWSVGESDVRADIETDRVHKVERKQDMKEKREDRKLQRQQLRVMERMDKRQHRSQILGMLMNAFGGMFNGSVGGFLRERGLGILEKLAPNFIGGLREKMDHETLKQRVIVAGTPAHPAPIVPIKVGSHNALPVVIMADYRRSRNNVPWNDEGFTDPGMPSLKEGLKEGWENGKAMAKEGWSNTKDAAKEGWSTAKQKAAGTAAGIAINAGVTKDRIARSKIGQAASRRYRAFDEAHGDDIRAARDLAGEEVHRIGRDIRAGGQLFIEQAGRIGHRAVDDVKGAGQIIGEGIKSRFARSGQTVDAARRGRGHKARYGPGVVGEAGPEVVYKDSDPYHAKVYDKPTLITNMTPDTHVKPLSVDRFGLGTARDRVVDMWNHPQEYMQDVRNKTRYGSDRLRDLAGQTKSKASVHGSSAMRGARAAGRAAISTGRSAINTAKKAASTGARMATNMYDAVAAYGRDRYYDARDAANAYYRDRTAAAEDRLIGMSNDVDMRLFELEDAINSGTATMPELMEYQARKAQGWAADKGAGIMHVINERQRYNDMNWKEKLDYNLDEGHYLRAGRQLLHAPGYLLTKAGRNKNQRYLTRRERRNLTPEQLWRYNMNRKGWVRGTIGTGLHYGMKGVGALVKGTLKAGAGLIGGTLKNAGYVGKTLLGGTVRGIGKLFQRHEYGTEYPRYGEGTDDGTVPTSNMGDAIPAALGSIYTLIEKGMVGPWREVNGFPKYNGIMEKAKGAVTGKVKGIFRKAHEKGKNFVNSFKKMYNDVDRQTEKAKSPKDILDKFINRAQSPEDIEAIKTAQQLNASAESPTVGKTDDGKKTTLFDLIKGAFGENGVFGKMGNVVGAISTFLTGGGIAASVAKLFGKDSTIGGIASGLSEKFGGAVTEGAAATAAGKAGTTVVTGATLGGTVAELGGIGATAYQLTKGNKLTGASQLLRGGAKLAALTSAKSALMKAGASDLIGNVTKNSAGRWVNATTGKFVKSTLAEAAEQTASKGLISSKISDLLVKIANSKVMQKLAGKLAPKLTTACNGVAKFLGEHIFKKAGEEGVKAGAKNFLKEAGNFITGGGLMVTTAVANGVYGATAGAKKYFQVTDHDVTTGMRVTAALVSAIGDLITYVPVYGMIAGVVFTMFKDKIVQMIYKVFANEDQEAQLANKQNQARAMLDIVNEQTGQNMDLDTFLKKYDIDDEGNIVRRSMFTVTAPSSGTVNAVSSGRRATTSRSSNSRRSNGRGPITPYSQRDHRWSGMAENGCGPTAAAMVASAYGNNVTPGQMNQMSYGMGMRSADGGTNPAFFTKMTNQFGRGAFRMQQGPVSGSAMAAAAQAGQPVAVMGKGGPYGGGEHYMVLEGAYGRGKTAVLRDPLTGGRKTVPMNSLVNSTDSAIYSKPGAGWGRGATIPGVGYVESDGTVANRTGTNNSASGQQAVVNQMKWLSNNKIAYSLNGPQDPDKGSASCASTVGWAYRKAFGVTGMSASSAEQSKDNRFVDVVRLGQPGKAPGKDFDLNLLQPGDIVYMKNPGSNHTEMYIGDGMDLSHGGGVNGTTPGPNTVKLDAARRKKVFAVRRYKPFTDGTLGTYTNIDPNSGGSTTGESSTEKVGFLKSLMNMITSFGDKIFGGKSKDSDAIADESYDSGNAGKATDVTLSGSNDKEKIWRFLRKNLGLTAIAAAGVMGNFQQESGNTARKMEADYTSGFKKIGFDKLANDADARDKWVKDWLWPVGYKNASWLNRDAYYGEDGHTYPGFGIAQWTGPRGYKLFKFAKANNLNWTDLTTQLDFFAHGPGEFIDRGLVNKMNAASSTDDAAYIFARDFEGNTKLAQQERKGYARNFYNQYKDLDLSEENVRAKRDNDKLAIHYGKGPATVYGSDRPMFGRGNARTYYGAAPVGWGHGPSVDLANNARSVTNQIARINSGLAKMRADQQTATTVETLAHTIMDASQTASANGNGEALLQTIATTLGSMLELMVKMSDKMDAKPANGGTPSASEVNRAYAYPTRTAPHYANGDTQAEDLGATIIRRLTAAT